MLICRGIHCLKHSVSPNDSGLMKGTTGDNFISIHKIKLFNLIKAFVKNTKLKMALSKVTITNTHILSIHLPISALEKPGRLY